MDACFDFDAEQFEHVLLDRVAERLASDPARDILFWKALYRVCAHGAKVTLRLCPRAAQDAGFPATPQAMQDRIMQAWSLDMDAGACFAAQHGISFGLISYVPVFAPEYHRMIKRRKCTQDDALEQAGTDRDVLTEIVFELIANKRFLGYREVVL